MQPSTSIAVEMDLPSPRIETEPRPEDVRFIEDRLYDYNVEQTGVGDGQWLAIFIRDDNGDLAAGLHGWTWGGGCRVQTFWVRSDLRRHGYGTKMLAAAEEEASARGCDRLLLDTFSFQAPLFYQKHGYEVVGVFDDVLPPHRLYRLRKSLKPANRGSSGGR
jgi:GNAT superfamily N-acetyltransferase